MSEVCTGGSLVVDYLSYSIASQQLPYIPIVECGQLLRPIQIISLLLMTNTHDTE